MAVRVIGLIIILVSVLYFVSAFIVCIDPTYRPNLSPAWHYFIDAVVELLIGLYLLRGAPHIVRFAFRDEDLDDKPDGANKSPEPTAVPSSRSFGAKADGACRSAIEVPVASRRWLFR